MTVYPQKKFIRMRIKALLTLLLCFSVLISCFSSEEKNQNQENICKQCTDFKKEVSSSNNVLIYKSEEAIEYLNRGSVDSALQCLKEIQMTGYGQELSLNSYECCK